MRDFCETTFARLDLDWEDHVEYDKTYERPAEVDLLIGDTCKASTKLGWQPKVRFKELVNLMIDADLEFARQEQAHQKAEDQLKG